MIEKTLQDIMDDLGDAVDNIIKNMETMKNTLEFEIPEGYEIDKEQSTNKKVVYKKVEKYEPKPHDIVVFDGLSMRRYITLYTAPDELYAPAVQYDLFEFNPKGEIYPLPVPLIGVKPASDFEKDLYKKTLADNGYEYDDEKKVVRKKKYEPKEGDLVYAETIFGNSRFIVLHKRSEDIVVDGILGSWSLYSPPVRTPYNFIRPATPDETAIFARIMSENGYEYDPEKKEVRKKRWRAEEGETYWYVYKNAMVDRQVEAGYTSDNILYESGNYFRTREEAEEVAAEFRAILDKRK